MKVGGKVKQHLIESGQLLFSWSGSRGTSFGAHIWNGNRAILNQHIFKVEFDPDRVTKKYLFHALNRSVAEVEENLHGGVGLVHITKGNLEKIEIPLPPIEVQREIVAEIEGYQKVIDGARAVIDNYRPHIPINPDWPMVELGEVCEINPESVDPQAACDNQTISYIDISSIENGTGKLLGFTEVSPEQAPSRARRVVKENDILLSTVRPNLKAFAILRNLPPRAIASTGFAVLRTNPKHLLPKYLIAAVHSDFAVEQMISRMGRGSYPSINQSDVEALRIPLPPVAEQTEMVADFDAEQIAVAANRDLIARFEKKIEAAINRVWGDLAGR